MSRLFYHVMQDNVGNLLFDVSGTMRIAGSGTLATIYGDEALTAILPNPMTNHPSFGSFKCFLGAGDYDFYMAKSGYTFETLTGVQGHGTMAQQDANNVVITGGVATLTGLTVTGNETVNGTSTMSGLAVTGNATVGGSMSAVSLASTANATVGGTVSTVGLTATGNATVAGLMALQLATVSSMALRLGHAKGAMYGLVLQPTDSDAGFGSEILFMNLAQTPVGSISTTGSATAYNTTSDARLKCDVEPLTGALDAVRALNPITHRWRADDSPGVGFLAHEVQRVTPEAVTGERDAIDEAGQIVPQQMDYGKLVPYLVSAVKELTQQVEMLTAKLAGAGA